MVRRQRQMGIRDRSSREADRGDSSTRTARLASVGGILAALGAASCCVVPFALFTLGISGAWISNLTALEPYHPTFAVFTSAFLGYGFYLVYRTPTVDRPDVSYCPNPPPGRSPKTAPCFATARVDVAPGYTHTPPPVP